MSLYKELCESLVSEEQGEELVLGIVRRKEPDIGKVEAQLTANSRARHSSTWPEGTGITWRYIPEIGLISFWELPTKQEMQAVKDWLIANNYAPKKIQCLGQAKKSIKIDRDSPDWQRRSTQGIDEAAKRGYCGVLLNTESQNKLKTVFRNYIPTGWTVRCHHMTIDPFKECTDQNMLGQTVELIVTSVGISELASAVKVVGYRGQTNNSFPHVTLAFNEKAGGAPKHSNNIQEWTPIQEHIVLTGVITNI